MQFIAVEYLEERYHECCCLHTLQKAKNNYNYLLNPKSYEITGGWRKVRY
jgi:hypothetical protein